MASPKTSCRQLPTDTKIKLIRAINAGESVAKAARRYHVNEDTAHSIMKKYKATSGKTPFADLWKLVWISIGK